MADIAHARGQSPGNAARPREAWTGQLGFILAAIGSAVGLGNIWRFPGVAYENGGGAFLIPYLVALLTAGIPILFLDYAVGHRFRGAVTTAFRRLGGPRGRWLEGIGWFQVTICFFIATYYTVIVAWAISYFVFSFDLRWGDDATAFFTGEFLNAGDPGFSFEFVPSILIPLVIVWLIVIGVLAAGVAKGIERVNFIAIPALAVGFLVLVIRALFLDGAALGLNELLTPNWASLADPNVWIAAYSQIFFSLSIAFGIMVTYSSYRRRKSNLTGPGLVVAFANSSFELLAGIGVFATLGFFAFQQNVPIAELEGLTGVGLSFMTFPAIVSEMPGGPFFGALFFGSLTLAGFTSLISILQVVSAAIQEKFNLSPRKGAVLVGVVSAIVSVVLYSTATGLHALDVVDQWVNNIGIVASAIVVSIVVLWVYRRGPELMHHINSLSTFKVGRTWWVFVTILAPVVLAYMLVSRIFEYLIVGYAEMPGWYLGIFGWGAILVMLIGTVILTALRWRKSPDDFTPWPAFPPPGDTHAAAPRTEARS